MGVLIQRMHDPDVLETRNVGFMIEVDKGEPIIGLVRKEYPKVWAKYQRWVSKDNTDDWSDGERQVYWGKRGLVLDERTDEPDGLHRIDGLMIYVRDGHALVRTIKEMYPKQFAELLEREKRGSP